MGGAGPGIECFAVLAADMHDEAGGHVEVSGCPGLGGTQGHKVQRFRESLDLWCSEFAG
ncbi:hypothetical protein GCM10020227_46630 [Streptomyces flavovirens]